MRIYHVHDVCCKNHFDKQAHTCHDVVMLFAKGKLMDTAATLLYRIMAKSYGVVGRQNGKQHAKRPLLWQIHGN